MLKPNPRRVLSLDELQPLGLHARAELAPRDVSPHVQPGQTIAVELHVDDPDRAARWLERWGLRRLRTTPDFIALEHNDELLFLGRRPRSRPKARGGTVGEIRVLVPDAAEMRRKAAPDDEVVVDLHCATYGLVEFVVASDFGIDLRIATPASVYGITAATAPTDPAD